MSAHVSPEHRKGTQTEPGREGKKINKKITKAPFYTLHCVHFQECVTLGIQKTGINMSGSRAGIRVIFTVCLYQALETKGHTHRKYTVNRSLSQKKTGLFLSIFMFMFTALL